MSGALPNRSTTSVSRQHRNHASERRKEVTSPTRAVRMPREIQPQHQNWLARFLRIKPAVTILCFQTSRIRARKEITAILRDWRKYGMKDVVVDKAAGRIWGRVAVKNCKRALGCLFHTQPLFRFCRMPCIWFRFVFLFYSSSFGGLC